MRGAKWLTLLSLLVIAGAVSGCSVIDYLLLESNAQSPAPDFSLTTLNEETITLSDLDGKVVVVNFWASWCAPCRDEAPILESIWEQYQDRDVVFIGIAYVDKENQVRTLVDEYHLTYSIGLDTTTQIAEAYRVTGVPETFVIDQNGRIVSHTIGIGYEENLKATLNDLLQ